MIHPIVCEEGQVIKFDQCRRMARVLLLVDHGRSSAELITSSSFLTSLNKFDQVIRASPACEKG